MYGLSGPLRALHDRPRNQLLADAALATQQHRSIRIRHRLDRPIHLLHRRAAAHQTAERNLLLRLRNNSPAFQFQRPLLQRALQHNLQLFEIERHEKKLIRASLRRPSTAASAASCA